MGAFLRGYKNTPALHHTNKVIYIIYLRGDIWGFFKISIGGFVWQVLRFKLNLMN